VQLAERLGRGEADLEVRIARGGEQDRRIGVRIGRDLAHRRVPHLRIGVG
jgi:hypothetical protein